MDDRLSPAIVNRKKRDLWQKGRMLDLWSIPHFLFGVLIGVLPALIEISFYLALASVIILAVAWEIFEKIIGVKESFQNIVLDIVLAIMAFTLTSLVLFSYPLSHEELLVLETAVLVLFLFTNISGWLAYRRRNRDFMH